MSQRRLFAAGAALAALLIVSSCGQAPPSPTETPSALSTFTVRASATAAPIVKPKPQLTPTPRPVIFQHSAPIKGIAFSPDGSLLAVSYVEKGTMPDPKFGGFTGAPFQAGTNTSWLHIWDLRSGKQKPDVRPDPNAGVVLVMQCPEGRVNCNNPAPEPASNTVVVMDCLWGNTNCHDPVSVAFSPDGRYIVAANWLSQLVTVWDAGTQHLVRYYKTQGVSGLTSIAFSPDGKTVAVGGWNGAIGLSDFNSGSTVRVLTGHSGWVNDLDFSADGSALASGSADGTLRLWEVKSGKSRTLDDGDKFSVESVVFSPDGKVVAAGEYGGFDSLSAGTVVLWDASAGSVQNRLKADGGAVYSVAFSPNGRLLAYATSDTAITLWDAGAAKAISTLRSHRNEIHVVAFSPDGKTLASADEDGAVILWPMPELASLPALVQATPTPAAVASAASSASDTVTPVIDSVNLRYQSTTGSTVVYQDIRFHDPDGDATTLHFEIVRSTSAGSLRVADGSIGAAARAQQSGAMVSGTWTCGGTYDVTLRVVIIDRLGHKSAPVDYTMNCKSSG